MNKLCIAFAVIITVFVQAPPVGASCNIIPDGNGFPPAPSGPDAPYKGALGRVEHVYLIPGRTKEYTVVPDQSCIGPNGKVTTLPPIAALAASDLIAVTVHGATASGTVYAQLYAADDVCDDIDSIKKEVELQRAATAQGPQVKVLSACHNEGVAILSGSDASKGVRLPVATESEIAEIYSLAAAAAQNVAAPPDTARVILIRKPTGTQAIASAVRQAAITDCSSACATAAGAGLLACIDRIFMSTEDSKGNVTILQDPITCHLDEPKWSEVNDFQKVCDVDDTSDPKLVKCDNSQNFMSLTLDECGGAHVPFDWSAIRASAENPNGIDRQVNGQSATGNKKKTEGNVIRLPGREFLASTPISDPMGLESNPRKPDIDVDNRLPQQLRLVGTVDSPDSIVHIYPRMFVSQKCSDGEACYSADPVNGNGDDCACTDRQRSGCSCTPVDPKQVFACDAGESKAMPCTRPDHCNPDGKCTAQPSCHTKHDIWEPGADFGDPDRKCWTDAECEQFGDDWQCGYSMFDLTELDEDGNGKIKLDAKIHDGGRKRRGACEGSGEACNNGAGAPTCPDDKACRGYVLHSGPKF